MQNMLKISIPVSNILHLDIVGTSATPIAYATEQPSYSKISLLF